MARLFDDAASQYIAKDIAVVAGPPYAAVCWAYTDVVASQVLMSLVDKDVENQRMCINFTPTDPWFNIISHGGAGFGQVPTTTQYSLNTWHHCCGIWVATNDRRVLLDNGGRATDNTDVTVSGLDRTSIGRFGDSSPSSYMSGRIAEAAIYDLSVWPGATASDKADAFEAVALPGLADGESPLIYRTGLVAYWPLINNDHDYFRRYDMKPVNGPNWARHPSGILYPQHQPYRQFSVGGAEHVFSPAMRTGLVTVRQWPGYVAAGGTTYYSSLAGAFTSAGILARKTKTTKAGALTSSGTITRKTATTKAGAFTSAGALTRQTSKSMAGALASAGALARKTAKTLAGALASAGALTRKTAKTLAGGFTSAGAVSKIRIFFKTLTSAFTSSGVLVRRTGKVVAGTLTSGGTISRAITRTLSGALTSAGTVTRRTSKTFAGALTSAGAVASSLTHRAIAKAFAVASRTLAFTVAARDTAFTLAARVFGFTVEDK